MNFRMSAALLVAFSNLTCDSISVIYYITLSYLNRLVTYYKVGDIHTTGWDLP